jgi:glyoxylase-like metal-dependent hydrolase (beta-lactamase superfamily II)
VSVRFSLTYLIDGCKGLVLVDAGMPGQTRRILELVDTSSVALIFVTHAHLDHYGGAAELRRCTGAPIAIHRADAGAMARAKTPLGDVRGRGRLARALMPVIEWAMHPEPTQADLLLDDGDSLRDYGIEGTVLHTPGHTPGSACLLVDGGPAFVGDLLSNTGRPHAQRYFASDWTRLQESLDRLKARRPTIVYDGHVQGAISGDVLERLTFV